MTTTERDAYRRDIVNRFKESGMTRKRFCNANGVALSTLDLWIRRYRNETNDLSVSSTNFVPIGKTIVTQHHRHLRVSNRLGITIELDLPASEEEITAVLRAIAAV